MKDWVITGVGPDSFAYVFPNGDVVSKFYADGGYNSVYHLKPHNMYLQIAVQTGSLSMIAFVMLFLSVIYKNMSLWGIGACSNHLCIAMIAGLTGYMVQGMFNDSSITTAPLFWAILGMLSGIDDNMYMND